MLSLTLTGWGFIIYLVSVLFENKPIQIHILLCSDFVCKATF